MSASGQNPTPQTPGMNIPHAPNGQTNFIPTRHHVHHSYIWLGGLKVIGILLFAAIVGSFSAIIELFNAMSTSLGPSSFAVPIIIGIGILSILVISGITLGIQAWSWRHLWYEVGPKEISIYSGIFSKKKIHVPYDRIQTIDQKASLPQRAFGVCNITIDTAGGANNKAVLIPYLRKSDAEALRHEVYARKLLITTSQPQPSPSSPDEQSVVQHSPTSANANNGGISSSSPQYQQPSQQGNILDFGDELWQQFDGVFAGKASSMEAPSFELRLTNKELLFTGLSNNTGFIVAIFVVLGIAAQIAGTAFDLFPSESDFLITSASSWFDIGSLVAICAAFMIGATLLIWVISALGSCIQYGGFHARRRGSRVEVERGLLQHQTESLDINRIQSIIVRQSFVRRLIGYCEVSLGKIGALDSSDDSAQKSESISSLVVHPFIKVTRVQEVLDGLVPEFADLPEASKRIAPVGLRRGLIRRCLWQGSGFWLAASTAIVQISLNLISSSVAPDIASALPAINMIANILYALAVVLLILDAVGTILWFKESSFAVNRHFARIKNGGFSTIDTSTPRKKIQFGSTKSNPFQRAAGTSTILMRTAAGVGGTTTQLIDVSTKDACDWLKWIEPFNSGDN